MAATLRVAISRTLAGRWPRIWISSGIGWKPGFSEAASSSSTVLPARASSFSPASRLIHAAIESALCVARRDFANLGGQMAADLDIQRNRLETGLLGGGEQFVDGLAGQGQQDRRRT